MKAHQYGILFVILAIALFIMIDIKTNQAQALLNEHNKMDRCLTQAVDQAVTSLSESYSIRHLLGSRENCIETFFSSLYCSLNLVSDPIAQNKLRLYFPVILITEEDGFYVFYHDEYQLEGMTTMAMRWSERFPYSYEDDYFVYNFSLSDKVMIYDKNHILPSNEPYLILNYHEIKTSNLFHAFQQKNPEHFIFHNDEYETIRQQIVITKLNDKINYYINEHNSIASQNGITYHFSLPVIDESEYMRSIKQPGIMVIFQGYPLRMCGELYNRVKTAGAQLYPKRHYYIEEKDWYKVYHDSTCEECLSNPKIDMQTVYDSVEECVKQGAYGCEKCTKGVHVPEYHVWE